MIHRYKLLVFNVVIFLNSLLLFLFIFEKRLVMPPWVQSLGRLHPILLHFPIVLLLICVFFEFFSRRKKLVNSQQMLFGDNLLLVTSFTAVTSALMGLVLSKEDIYKADLLIWHKWGGVFISFLSMVWYVFRQSIRNKKILFTAISLGALGGILITSHLGANITHGDNFLLAPLSNGRQQPKVLFEDVVIYNNMVQPILQSKCIGCHNEKKAKGELVMETYANLLKGGKNGVLWDSTKNNFGLLLNRIHLPLEDKKHMPPSGKPQLTEDEANIIYYWIVSGANSKAKVATLPSSDTLRMLAKALFNSIKIDEYNFKAADENKIKALSNNYRFVTPVSQGSPALEVEFYGASKFKADQLLELLPLKEQIVTLILNKIPVRDAELSIIAQFLNLRKLNLSFTEITGKELIALQSLKHLNNLSLAGTKVNSVDLQILSTLPKLTHLYIWNTPAQMQVFSSLKNSLKNNIIIETGFTGDSVQLKLPSIVIMNELQMLSQPTLLKLKHYSKGVSIYFTIDGTEPDSLHSILYNGAYKINDNMIVKAKAFKKGWSSSDIVQKEFYKVGVVIDSIKLLSPSKEILFKTLPPSILTDSKKGDSKEIRFGHDWIGYKDQKMESIIYLAQEPSVSSVTISSLVSINNFIMPPQQIQIWASNDLVHYNLIKKVVPPQPSKLESINTKLYTISFPPLHVKYLKVVLIPIGRLPIWIKGGGGVLNADINKKNPIKKGWVFVDEIYLN
jgi:uncharacterized membrane protein